jgi:hypothetical protein
VDVQKAIKDKNEWYKSWHHNRSTRNMVKYKEAKKNARPAVSEARGRTYDELYDILDEKKARKISTSWRKFVRGRRGTSTKLSVLRTRLIDF